MVGNEPLYRQVKADLGARIRAGEWGPHERIPSERELCAIHGLSRTTVRLAIDEAVREGLLYRVPGRGTFVAEGRRRIEQELLEVTSFERTLHARGLTPSMRVLAIRRRAADFALARLLRVETGEHVWEVDALGLADRAPVVHYASTLPGRVFARVRRDLRRRAEREGDMFHAFDAYARAIGETSLHLEQTYEAAAAEGGPMRTLGLHLGAPVLRVTTVVSTPGGEPLEWRVATYRSDIYKFHIARTYAVEEG